MNGSSGIAGAGASVSSGSVTGAVDGSTAGAGAALKIAISLMEIPYLWSLIGRLSPRKN